MTWGWREAEPAERALHLLPMAALTWLGDASTVFAVPDIQGAVTQNRPVAVTTIYIPVRTSVRESFFDLKHRVPLLQGPTESVRKR